MAEFDDRSEKNLATLRPKAQPHFRALLRSLKTYATAKGLDARIISANRTWAEQDALYAQGRTKPGPKVTNARGGQSNHNYQIAVDVGLFEGRTYLGESPHYRKMGPLGEALGLEWGGRWRGFPDTPHYQVKTGRTVSALNELVRTKGWGAVDALIPDLVEGAAASAVARAGMPAAAGVPDPVAVYLDNGTGKRPKRLKLGAWFLDSQVWLTPLDWEDDLGGTMVEKGGKFRLYLNGQATPIRVQSLGDQAITRFADINAVLGWNYSLDGLARPRQLTIHLAAVPAGPAG